jgi:uncharacterized protein (DUF362 family)
MQMSHDKTHRIMYILGSNWNWYPALEVIIMSQLSRRDFLRILALGAGSLTLPQFLTGCDRQATSALPAATPRPPSTQSPLETPYSTSPVATIDQASSATANPADNKASTPLPAGTPDLVVARGSDPETIVRRALAAIGGMENFVPRNASVIIKPNICVAYHTYEYAATTNPWVVAALVKVCLEAGARSVQVMDLPFGGTQQEAYAKSGIGEQVEAAGGEMVYMPSFKYFSADIPQGIDLKKTTIFGDVQKADVLINVPIAKHHGLARLTLGMKNLMGLIKDRPSIHSNLGQRLADLASLFQPTLTVVDAVRILVANGPSGGNLDDVKQMDTVIVSPDIVAADSYATTLFDMRPEDIAYIPAAAAMGLGRSDLQSLKIEEIAT